MDKYINSYFDHSIENIKNDYNNITIIKCSIDDFKFNNIFEYNAVRILTINNKIMDYEFNYFDLS
jgi:hypothetical protein